MFSTRVALAARKAAVKPVRNLTSFGLFMRMTAKDAALNALPVAKRGKALGKMWRALPAAQKKTMAAQAKKVLVKPKAPKVKKARKPTAYNLFVKKNYASVKNLAPKQRLAAIGKMWKAVQKK
jgi:hypothetical protein